MIDDRFVNFGRIAREILPPHHIRVVFGAFFTRPNGNDEPNSRVFCQPDDSANTSITDTTASLKLANQGLPERRVQDVRFNFLKQTVANGLGELFEHLVG